MTRLLYVLGMLEEKLDGLVGGAHARLLLGLAAALELVLVDVHAHGEQRPMDGSALTYEPVLDIESQLVQLHERVLRQDAPQLDRFLVASFACTAAAAATTVANQTD